MIDIEFSLKEHDAIQEMVVQKKYCHEGETTLSDVKERVASFIVNKDLRTWFKNTQSFLPAGSILSGLGSPDNSSLSNCYYTPIEEDSIEGIFDACKRMARTYSFRGGTGVGLSILRPKNHKVANAAKRSSGAVSFMPLLSETTNTIGQHGRRGALMISLDVRHPDVLDFIWSKSKPEQVFGKDALTGRVPDVYGANISVMLTGDFMRAVMDGEDWVFKFPNRDADPSDYDIYWDGNFDEWDGEWRVYGRMPAQEVMRQIAESAWISGDPGVLFMDTVFSNTPGSYISPQLTPQGTNPCGEQPLADWNNCLLGAMVLSKYVKHPWTDKAQFDVDRFLNDVHMAVKFLNEMSDINVILHPLQEQRDADLYGKRIGVEFTGLADAMAMMNFKYGKTESITWLENLLKLKAEQEIRTSMALAVEKGCCPALESRAARKGFLGCEYIKRLELSESLKESILEFGLRNTAFNTVGPTGSLSILAGNCTSGIEPLYAMSYQRITRLSDEPYMFLHKPALLWAKENNFHGSVDELKEKLNYVESHEVSWQDRIAVQEVVQRYTDSAVSSTVNLPNTATVDEIMDIYITAWKRGLKGITIFRDGCKKGVLSTGADKKEENSGLIVKDLLDLERAERHRILWKGAKMYVIVSLDDDDQPVEVFVKLPREAGLNGGGLYREEVYQEKFSLWETITRMASLLLRTGIPLPLVIKQLDKSSYSVTDASAILSRVLRKYVQVEEDEEGEAIGEECPDCGDFTYINIGGCATCQSCGFSQC